MLRNNTLMTSPVFKLILGLSLCTLGGAMLFIYFRDEENREIEDKKKDKNKTKSNVKSATNKKTSSPNEITTQHLTISNEHIPLIVGRSGSNLNLIEEKTGTKIEFKDKDESHKTCEIRGYPMSVAEAKLLLLKEIERSPIVKEEISVPQSVCGKIIGRCGESMQEICRLSLAKVSVESGAGGIVAGHNNRRRIIITGNRTQVNIARKLIEDKIQEDEEIRNAVAEIEQKREPRRSPTNSQHSSQNSLNLVINLPPKEKLPSSNDAANDQPMEVYVSAIATPSKFWVQLIGPQSKKLDELVRTMTEYYELESNRRLHRIIEPYLGQIVAVVFKYDDKWYRAEIVGILPNQYNPKEVVLDLFFVDYGDSEYVAPHEVFELRTDFLTLRFQAIECFLANIKSNDINDPDNWDKQAIQTFEDFTQVAAWKKLTLKIKKYKDRPKTTGNRPARESSPVPGVELLDTNEEGHEMSIADILISQGLAMSDNQTTSSDEVLRLGGGDSLAQQPAAKDDSSSSKFQSVEDAILQEQSKRHLKGTTAATFSNGQNDSAALTINGNFVAEGVASTIMEKRQPQSHNVNGNLVT